MIFCEGSFEALIYIHLTEPPDVAGVRAPDAELRRARPAARAAAARRGPAPAAVRRTRPRGGGPRGAARRPRGQAGEQLPSAVTTKNPPSVRIFKAHILRSIRTSYFHIRLL